MKTRILFLLAAAMALLILLTRGAAALLPILIIANSGIGFGQIAATSTPGTVTVTSAGTRTASGGVALGSGLGVTPASFTVTGDPHASYSITLPAAATLSGGGGSMTVDTFTSSPSSSGNLGLVGLQIFSVGATLHVGASQHAAAYSGTYNVSVAYN
jgi:hypothetical protein